MTPETTHEEKDKSNTVALVGMILSILGLFLVITVIFSRFGLILLLFGFILGIIGLFFKPRGKARVAIIIPVIIYGIIIGGISCFWGNIKQPTTEFISWIVEQNETKRFDNLDNKTFNTIVNEEFNQRAEIFKNNDVLQQAFEAATGSSSLEKAAYLFFDVVEKELEDSFEKYDSLKLGGENIESSELIEEFQEEDGEDFNLVGPSERDNSLIILLDDEATSEDVTNLVEEYDLELVNVPNNTIITVKSNNTSSDEELNELISEIESEANVLGVERDKTLYLNSER